ncbi:MAG: tRNA (adenosine(37)-N6)-dimethylallyltransferase MiaA [Fimbriimonadaceae bacterium]|nr:tRNA (adenosine(37)-N6)-dimethylallyltransferase MiaA [Fimbriimonadaceae bacterium]
MRLICIMGPTGSGKSDLAEALSDAMGGRLVNADAVQVYRGLDVGTGKSDRAEDYALISYVDPIEEFGVGRYLQDFASFLAAFRESPPSDLVLAGGTGLYIRALTEGYTELHPPPDPALRAELAAVDLPGLRERLLSLDPSTKVDLANPVRVRRALERMLDPRPPIRVDLPRFTVCKLALTPPPDHADRLRTRIGAMLAAGWVQEVEALMAQKVPRDAPGMKAIGYDQVVDLIQGRISMPELVDAVFSATKAYGKRQMTWLRREPGVQWLEPLIDSEGVRRLARQLKEQLDRQEKKR